MTILTATLGFFLWYFIFGIECCVNGAESGKRPWLMPFRELLRDLRGPAPYGLIHMVFIHLVLPTSPTLLWWLITGRI